MHEILMRAGLLTAFVLAGCASSAKPVASSPSPPLVHVGTELVVAREPPHMRLAHPNDLEERRDDEVFRAMQPQLLACYARRLTTHPTAHAYVTFDVLVGLDGRPRDVATTGGALLGNEALSCLSRHVRRATFAPPPGGGTSRVRVPFAFHPDAAAEGP